jgi:hypothetical protein
VFARFHPLGKVPASSNIGKIYVFFSVRM